jgi:hypothetical protein
LRSERRAAARRLAVDVPFYSIVDGMETTLFLMNNVSDPIVVDLTVRNHEDRELALGQFVIEPLNHEEIALSQLLLGFEREFGSGSVRCELLGDVDTLQGWAVVSDERGESFELPFATAEGFESNRLRGFWDWAAPGLGALSTLDLHLLNTTDQVVRARLEVRSANPGTSSALELAPREHMKLEIEPGSRLLEGSVGSLELRHDGAPGAVLGVAIGRGPSLVQAVELFDPEASPSSSRYESLPLPQVDGNEAAGGSRTETKAWVTLFDDTDVSQRVAIEILDGSNGSLLGDASVHLRAGSVRTIPLTGLIDRSRRTDGPLRLRVRAETAPLRVRGGVVLADGSISDLAFFAYEDAHGRGTYPLPNLERYETVTTLVNLGDEDALIGVQVHWRRGTYALGPLTVPARGVYRIDLEKMSESAAPDVLGRELDRRRPDGVLKWTVMKGSNRLIGRTEARRRNGEDRFGFNCFGCCWENAFASIEPGLVEFTPGESRSFQSCLTYNDCSGTMGPYPVTPETTTVPSPFSWDSSTITAFSAADAGIEFGVQFQETSVTCTVFLKWLFGRGRAELCQETFNPRGYKPQGTEEQTCAMQTESCFECRACCENIFQMLLCQGKNLDVITSNRRECLQICELDYDNSCN